ncbi:hypothetical protein PO909_008121 [Leuciscus waleckii]
MNRAVQSLQGLCAKLDSTYADPPPVLANHDVVLQHLLTPPSTQYVGMEAPELQLIECTEARSYNISSKADRGDFIIVQDQNEHRHGQRHGHRQGHTDMDTGTDTDNDTDTRQGHTINSGQLIIPRISKSTAGSRSFSYLAP